MAARAGSGGRSAPGARPGIPAVLAVAVLLLGAAGCGAMAKATGAGMSGKVMTIPGSGGPSITVTSPSSNARVDTDEVLLQGVVLPQGAPVRQVTISVGSQRVPATLGPQGQLQVRVPLAWGRNVVRVTAVDANGDSSETALKVFRVETGGLGGVAAAGLPPRLAIAFPPKGHEVVEGRVNLLATVSSGEGVERVEIFVNGALVSAPVQDAAAGDVVLNEAIPLSPGSNILTVTARDKRGRISQSVRRVTFVSDPRALARERPLGPIRRRMAVVVGISEYAHSGIPPLRYAHRDAEVMAELLRDQGFDDVHLLVNEEATSANLRHELFDFVRGAIEEDLVVIFFAGHGAPDPQHPQTLYLLTYDSDPARMAATALSMLDLETAIDRRIVSERVVLIADACHSGGIGGGPGVRGVALIENASHEYLQAIASSRGRVAFTASEARELSQESEKWGGGHGVFTWYLLRGLRGEADVDGDGTVTLGEAIDYTRENVRRETRNAQHPDTAGSFDRAMPLVAVR